MAKSNKRTKIDTKPNPMDEIDMPVHPAATYYPMWTDEEIDDLGDSIETRGLHHPIETAKWKETTDNIDTIISGIIDGRNRFVACKRKGIEPTFKEVDFGLDDEKIRLYILDNNRRRNLSAGQLAMAWAMTFPVKRGRPSGNSLENDKRTKNPLEAREYPGFSEGRLLQARQILSYSNTTGRGLEIQVMNGAMKFDAALNVVTEAAKEAARKAQEEREDTDLVTAKAPDKMALVTDGELDLKEAAKQVREEEARAKADRERMFGRLKEFLQLHHIILDGKNIDEVPEWLENDDYMKEFHKFFSDGVIGFAEQVERIDDTARLLKALAEKLKPAKDARPALRVVTKAEDTK